jgi:hypothetical protein
MWMKNTPLSLDMVFINEAAGGRNSRNTDHPFSETIIPSPGPVRYVLELNAGTAAKHGIRAGDRVRHRVSGHPMNDAVIWTIWSCGMPRSGVSGPRLRASERSAAW